MRRTRVIATLSGSITDAAFREMARYTDCVRINLSHGSFDDHARIIRIVRAVEQATGRYIPVLFDLAGPKIRVSGLHGTLTVVRGDSLLLVATSATGSTPRLQINLPEILDRIEPGHRILIDDGRIRCRAGQPHEGGWRLDVIEGGTIAGNKGVNLPDTELPLPPLTAKDLDDLDRISALDADYVAQSFVRSADDIRELRAQLKRRGLAVPIIAKIERPEALRVLPAIVDAADGVMVARGDLGVELSAEKVPHWQKRIVAVCRDRGKPVIVATQMLESMIEHPEPTRAEVSDIANAVLDGADVLMLSGETAFGRHPLESLKVLDRVARETERHDSRENVQAFEQFKFLRGDQTSAIAFSAYVASCSLGARAIVSCTASGQTPALLSKFRAAVPVYAASTDIRTLRRAALCYGVKPLLLDDYGTTDEGLLEIERALLGSGACAEGDLVVMTIGLPAVEQGSTNMLKVHTLGGYLPLRDPALRKKSQTL